MAVQVKADHGLVRTHEKLNGNGRCPHCNGTALIPDLSDLACLNCGWREADYLYKTTKKQIPPHLLARLIYNSMSVLPK